MAGVRRSTKDRTPLDRGTDPMIIRQPDDIPSSEITPESIYVDRRRFLRLGAAGAAAALVAPGALAACDSGREPGADAGNTGGALQEKTTPYEDVTTYNNFYEFGTAKSDPSENAGSLRTKPWSVAIEGYVRKPGTYALEDFLKPHKLEDRVYR